VPSPKASKEEIEDFSPRRQTKRERERATVTHPSLEDTINNLNRA